MSEANPFRIFVAHVFSEHVDYLRVFEYLESRPNFFYINVSQPGAGQPGDDYESLQAELEKQIGPAEIVVVPISLHHKNPVLITFQINAAKRLGKPVLGIKSFGDTLEMPRSILDRSDDIVDWNARAIVDAIRRLARQENTAQWEVIEFKPD